MVTEATQVQELSQERYVERQRRQNPAQDSGEHRHSERKNHEDVRKGQVYEVEGNPGEQLSPKSQESFSRLEVTSAERVTAERKSRPSDLSM